MSARQKPWRLLAVHPGKPHQGFPTQFRVENATFPPTEFWDAEYINFSGYFGSHGPAVFAAAPDLLAALKPFADIGLASDPDYQPMVRMDREAVLAARAAIAKATGQ